MLFISQFPHLQNKDVDNRTQFPGWLLLETHNRKKKQFGEGGMNWELGVDIYTLLIPGIK